MDALKDLAEYTDRLTNVFTKDKVPAAIEIGAKAHTPALP